MAVTARLSGTRSETRIGAKVRIRGPGAGQRADETVRRRIVGRGQHAEDLVRLRGLEIGLDQVLGLPQSGRTPPASPC